MGQAYHPALFFLMAFGVAGFLKDPEQWTIFVPSQRRCMTMTPRTILLDLKQTLQDQN